MSNILKKIYHMRFYSNIEQQAQIKQRKKLTDSHLQKTAVTRTYTEGGLTESDIIAESNL
jgi:hypothetical protein